MRVIFVNSFFYPDQTATSQLLTDVAFDLAEAGHDVAVIASARTYAGQKLPHEETRLGVRVHRLAAPEQRSKSLIARLLRYAAFYIQAPIAVFRHAKRGDIVVVKTDPPMLAVVLLPVIWIRRVRLVNWLQDLYPEVAINLGVPMLRSPLGGLLRVVRNWSLKSAARNIVIGNRMADRVAAQGVPRDRIVVLSNWTGDIDAAGDGEMNPLRAAWNLEGKFVLGYSGNLGRAHEVDTFLSAAELLREVDDIRFLFVGTGHLLDELKAEAARRGLVNLVFQPHQEREMLRFSLAAPDVHWVSLRPEMEGLIVPSKLYGILAARRPAIIVADSQGELADYVRQYGLGIQVDVADGAGFAAAILRLRGDPEERLAMGANGRKALDTHFTRAAALAAMRTHLEHLAQ